MKIKNMRIFRSRRERKHDMRIADIIDSGGKRRRKGSSGGSLCSSPRRVLSRCLSYLKSGSREPSNSESKVELVEAEERRTDESGRGREDESKSIDGSLLLGCQIDGERCESSSSRVEDSSRNFKIVESSGICTNELSFNLGLGVGLGFLIAESKNEFKRMTELRIQMEILVKEIKGGMHRRDLYSVESEANNELSHSPGNSNGVGRINYHSTIPNHQTSNALVETEIRKDCNQSPKCDSRRREACPVAIGQLEAELEAELELLQYNFCNQDSPRDLLPERGEVIVENDALVSRCFEEVNDFRDSDTTEHNGICPFELERRLHEVLEARQQERIAELEFALDCSQHNLLEKEMQISWWKDTAKLISQRVPKTCLSR